MATKWGICSAGKISNDFVVALSTLPAVDHQVVAIAARDLEKAKNFAQNHNIPKAYGSYEELAKDPDIDVIYVGAIHPVHRDVVLMCLQNGKNILCEKPLAMNAAQVQELIATARKFNVFLMEAFWSRFFPVYEEIRALLSQKAIGDVKFIRAEFGVEIYKVPRAVEKELGGGALLDIGCYCVQFVTMVFNGERPESVTAKGFLHETGKYFSSSDIDIEDKVYKNLITTQLTEGMHPIHYFMIWLNLESFGFGLNPIPNFHIQTRRRKYQREPCA
ncbi:hypothetical protein XENTR_v10019355 [Xenopus tropicalis]|nr:hypothetical protein XENTR_v10019355 [Xenopus tropicalis]KAE8593867.1 hypothetical protein XENTR_v10019355 [Xenopus tropicalis]